MRHLYGKYLAEEETTYFYTCVFLQITQTRYNVLIHEL